MEIPQTPPSPTLEKSSSETDFVTHLSELVQQLIKEGKSENIEMRLFAATCLKQVYTKMLILKNSKNPIWAEPEGQKAVDLWLNFIKEQIELI